ALSGAIFYAAFGGENHTTLRAGKKLLKMVLSCIPVGACACGAEGPMTSIGPLALGSKGCVERLHRFAQGVADWRSG
ncbi:hypothetical protein, partial [uncultured Dialister sp.]|uniref:hypothetical protein n=1 Tax=uncultured Dialister sp. TaxID=278064 RepID=UPI00265DECF0